MRQAHDPDLLSPQDAATFLGVRLATLRQWVREGKVPMATRNGKKMFHRKDLERIGREAQELAATLAVNRFLAFFVPKLRWIFHWRNGRERGIARAEWPEGDEP
jgi:hypothetical protein